MDASTLMPALPPPPEGFAPLAMLETPPTGYSAMPVPLMPKREGLGPDVGAMRELPGMGGHEPSLFNPRPELIDAIVHHESGGQPGAIGKKGERGLMQIMPATAADYGITDLDQLSDPNVNRQLGTRYFGDLLKRYKGNEFLALMAYNEGPGNIDKGRFFPQSVKYANAVLGRAGAGQPGGMQPPMMMAQEGSAAPQQQQQPGFLGQVGGAISSALGEGTAEAGELPPPPEGFGPMPTGSTAEVPTVAPSGVPAGMPPATSPLADPAAAAAPIPPTAAPSTGMMIPPIGTPGLPPGMRLSIGSGPIRATVGGEVTTAEVGKEEALRRQAMQLINLGTEMDNLYRKRIEPKLKSGQIHSLGEGLIYSERANARALGEDLDPDVEDWIVKSGQFSTGLNSYYAAQSGGRGGVSYLEQATQPHVPHPPAGLREVFGVWSPTGSQWDLEQQGEQLPKIMHNLRRDMGMEPEQAYTPYSSDQWVRLPSGKLYNPATGATRHP